MDSDSPNLRNALRFAAFLGISLCTTGGVVFGADQSTDASIQSSRPNTPVSEMQRSASDFISRMGQDAIGFLGNDDLSMNEKMKKFSVFLDQNFDMKSIGRFCLSSYWKRLSEEDQVEYQNLFKEMIVSIYSAKFSDYQGQKFEVKGEQSLAEGDIIVQSLIRPLEGESIPVDWQVRQKDDGYKVMDVKIEGVSMVITKKSEFSTFIQRNGGDPAALLQGLREKKLAFNNTLEPSEGL